MKTRKATSSSLQLLIQLQKLSARKNNSGYALLMVSMISILLFSMLSVYVFSSNLYKASADSILDSGSTFYAAELGLNKRSNKVKKSFDSYSRPSGVEPTGANIAAQMDNCINGVSGVKGSGDFECKVEETTYKESSSKGGSSADGSFSSTNSYNTKTNVKYRSFSFVKDISSANPQLEIIESGNFQGLRAQNYRYRVYSTATKQGGTDTNNVSAQSMLQMEFINRLIPVFQFAAFYENDLEFFNSGAMTITGPIHTNKSLYLAPGGFLTLNNRATFAEDVYKSLPFNPTHGVTSDGQRVLMTGGGSYGTNNISCVSLNCLNISTGTVPSSSSYFPAKTLISAANITNSNGMLKKQNPLLLPATGFLSRAGEYYNKADVRVDFNPGRTGAGTPFNVTSINRSATPAPTSVNFSTFSGLIDSLQKPVLLRIDSFAASKQGSAISRLCPRLDGLDGKGSATAKGGEPNNAGEAMPSLTTPLSSLTLPNRVIVINALQTAIAQTPVTDASLAYNQFKVKATGTLFTKFTAALPVSLATIANENLNAIAALNTLGTSGNGGCFLPAPMQVISGIDRKENYSSGGRSMTILQSHIKSLMAWNRDGRYWNGTVLQPTAELLYGTKRAARLATVPLLPEPTVPTGTNTKAGGSCDFNCLEMSPFDTTEGGLVWHYSMIDKNSPYIYTSGDGISRSDTKGQSPYGFAFSGGRRLPGPLTIASDQAIYIQGDYNNPSRIAGDEGSNPDVSGVLDLDQSQFQTPTSTSYPPAIEKKPASFLGDSATALSNFCYNETTYKINCLTATMPAADATTSANRVRFTVIRAAILSGTESSKVNSSNVMIERGAGLNNHFRMLEDWSSNSSTTNPDKTIKYRGSLVSKGIPTEFNGQYQLGGSYYNIPNRDFGFDNDFNRADGLPPLTPRVNLLNQKVFKRDYDSKDR
jgi:hypothetical protein